MHKNYLNPTFKVCTNMPMLSKFPPNTIQIIFSFSSNYMFLVKGIYFLSFGTHMHVGSNGGHWFLCAFCMPVGILYQLLEGRVDNFVNNLSGINNHHPRVPMHVASSYVCKSLQGWAELHQGYQ